MPHAKILNLDSNDFDILLFHVTCLACFQLLLTCFARCASYPVLEANKSFCKEEKM